jgi:hypothetical protein
MLSSRSWISTGFLIAGLMGCSGSKEAQRPDDAAASVEPAGPRPIRPERASGEKVTEVDINGDKRPDVWSYTVKGKGADGAEKERLVRKELDLDWDGRVDLTQYYDEREAKVREAMDLDFDGKVDSVYFFEKGVNIRREEDVNSDGRPDVWKFYEKGKLVRKERDSNDDGKVDYWEYWEKDQVDRIGEDVDGDGNVDRWTKNPNAE